MIFKRRLRGFLGVGLLCFLVFHLVSFYDVWKTWKSKATENLNNVESERVKSAGCNDSGEVRCEHGQDPSPPGARGTQGPSPPGARGTPGPSPPGARGIPEVSYDPHSQWTMQLILNELNDWFKSDDSGDSSRKTGESVDFQHDKHDVLEEAGGRKAVEGTPPTDYGVNISLVAPHDGSSTGSSPGNISDNIEQPSKMIHRVALLGPASQPSPLPPGPTVNQTIRAKMMEGSPLVSLRQDKYWPIVLPPSEASVFASIDFSRYSPQDREFLEGRVGVYEARARQVGQACEQQHALATPTTVKTFVWDQKHQPNLVWCQMSKVASTTWMVNFLRLAHYRENDPTLSHLPPKEREAAQFEESQFLDVNMHTIVYRFFPAPDTTVMRDAVFREALRVIIVRHPFSRLLSAYRDKLTTLSPRPLMFNFRQLQLDIISRYRSSGSNETSIFPTFEEFAQYVIDSTAHLHTLKDWRKVVCWTPYWVQCGVCANDFQLIMKLETMEDDERFLVTLADLQELKEIHERRNAKSSSSTSHHHYFKQLSTQQMLQLHQRYLLDFQLFGYSLDEYLPLARDAPDRLPPAS
ncbi:carbohydrate sulfotransferase 8 [Procambarus clarkii]|uniref:carbohydrate sulfotransferase 8 n=1 Tax=Procambarus clarkii TaxID=6728 RepID=UPI001E670C9B|nr:uncharacterized protein LOC123767089 [Procambarus clarkii]